MEETYKGGGYHYYYYYYETIEEVVKELLEYAGYVVNDQTIAGTEQNFTDLVLTKNDQSIYAVLKTSQELCANASMILATVNGLARRIVFYNQRANFTPVLIFVGIVDEDIKKKIATEELSSSVQIWDVRDLLSLTYDNFNLRNKFISALPFSIERYLPTNISADDSEETQKLKNLLWQVRNWKSPCDQGQTYEKLCFQVLNALFNDDLSKWYKQTRTEEQMFRFDLICKIKNEHHRDFWDMAERFFLTKYIVFEFKDYQNPISQREVFTTVKYLYATALRRIAILICANGINENAQRAIRGILRDEGKLILALDHSDLICMLQSKINHNAPSDYLSEKLDALLIELEK